MSVVDCLVPGDGFRPVRALQTISAINLTQADADMVAAPLGDTRLRTERSSYLQSARVAEATQSLHRSDACNLVAKLWLSKEGP